MDSPDVRNLTKLSSKSLITKIESVVGSGSKSYAPVNEFSVKNFPLKSRVSLYLTVTMKTLVIQHRH